MAERDQNEGSGQQPPIGQENDNQKAGQSGQQEQGQQSQQGQGQQADPQDDADTATLSEGSQPEPASQSDQDSGGFVGTKREDSGEYLQEDGTPESGFAEQGQGAPDQSDIERGTERSQDRDSDIEGSSGNN